jgi:hypothetical protein
MKFIRTFKLHESITDLRGELEDLGFGADPWKALITLRYPELEEYPERVLNGSGIGEFGDYILELKNHGASLSKLKINFRPDRDEPWSHTILKKIAAGNFGLEFQYFHIWDESDHEEYYQKYALEILQKIQSYPNHRFVIDCQDKSSFGLSQFQEKTSNPLVGWSNLVFLNMYDNYKDYFEKHAREDELDEVSAMFFRGDGFAQCSIQIWTDFSDLPDHKIDPTSSKWQANFGN